MSVEEINATDVRSRVDQFVIVDVRSQAEFDGPLGHLDGANLLPLPDLKERVDEISTVEPLLLVCRSGQRSAKACHWLDEQGIGRVFNLSGGMIAWNGFGLPVSRTPYADAQMLLDAIVDWLQLTHGEMVSEFRTMLSVREAENGSSLEGPSPSAISRALADLSERLRTHQPPADFEIAMARFAESASTLASTAASAPRL